MPEITDRPTQVSELANRAAGLLKSMLDAADEADKRTAFEAYRDVLRLIGRHHIQSYEGRTALLAGLILELKEVTDAVQVEHPIAEQLNALLPIVERARALFQEDKAEAEASGP